jgi:zinc protease
VLLPSSVPGPESIARRVLANGIVALARENFTGPSVVVQGYLRAGSVDEPGEKAGLAAFTADCLERGTENRTFAQISEEIEAVGASLHLWGGLHTTGFTAKCLAEDLDLVLGILADVLLHPTFPAQEVEKVRGEILTDLEERDNDTRRVAYQEFRALAYPPGHPYGRSSEGYKETVQAIGRDDLVAFHRDCYRPQGTLIAMVGAVKAEEALSRLETGFEFRVPSLEVEQTGFEFRVPSFEVERINQTRRKVRPMAGKTQTDIVLGFPALSRTDPQYQAANLADLILGGFGLMGRLGKNVRDEQGLAYYAFSRLEAGLGPGPWLAAAGVNPRNVERAISGILDELRRLRERPVEADELADSKAYLTGSMPLRLETNEGVARAILDMELYGLGLDYLQRYPGLVEAVTVEEVQAVAQAYLDPDRYALAIAGPYGE